MHQATKFVGNIPQGFAQLELGKAIFEKNLHSIFQVLNKSRNDVEAQKEMEKNKIKFEEREREREREREKETNRQGETDCQTERNINNILQ